MFRNRGAAPAAPALLDDTELLLDQFEREGVLRVASPDGEGTYTFVKDKRNIKAMPVTLYWDGKKHGSSVHREYPDHPADPVYGAEIAYSVYQAGAWPRGNDQRAIVATVLQFIQSGRLVYMNECGGALGVGRGAAWTYMRPEIVKDWKEESE